MGAGRPLGAALVQRLRIAGEHTRAVLFDTSRTTSGFDESVEVVTADPLDQLSLEPTCRGATAIYNCFEPLLSKRQELGARVNSNLLLSAINERAALVIASRLFNSEFDNQPLEADAMEAAKTGVAKVVVAQLPQLYGPEMVNEVLADVFEAAIKGKKAHWPGPLDARRSLVYALDAADALVCLARAAPALGRSWAIAGPAPMTGRLFIETAFAASEKVPRFGSGLAGIVPMGHPKTPYDYEKEFLLDGTDFSLAFPEFNFTSHETAIAATLQWYRERMEIKQKLGT